jgi:undecaprenyldiphospho-muramoylpentapeptide beta-N-acetylglucosaminyltransferase
VFPALAIVAALGSRADVLWVGSEGGMEADLVTRAGIRFDAVPAAGVHGVGLRSLPGNVAALVRGTRAARRILRDFRPDALLLTGGYVGIPAALASRGTPKVLYVPDIEPALAARWIARWASVVAVTTEGSRAHYPKRVRTVVTGYPTRPDLVSVPRTEARARLGLDSRGRVLLVLGGSLGARSINQAVWGGLPALLEAAQVVHLTGEAGLQEGQAARDALPAELRSRYRPFGFLHDDISLAYSAADLVVGRAGASALGELPLFGLPSILVPYPYAWRYQKVNADYLAQRAAAVILADERLAPDLVPTVRALLSDPERLAAMSSAARRQASPDAARRIADVLIDAARPGEAAA